MGERIVHYSSNMRLLVDKVSDHPGLLDTSELLRPEAILKEKEAFRDYTKNDALGERVKRTYTEMHTKQTMAFVMEKHNTWLKFNHMEATIMEALDMLNELVDESDPDLDLPNIVHAFQTAERIREEHPDKEWFQNNPDTYDSRYNTKLGIYKEGCGIENVIMSWGHDEYLYHVLVNHMAKMGTSIPEGGLWAIRFHSCYPWHTGGDYGYLAKPQDEKVMEWVKEFNKFDLYTKSTKVPDIKALKPYYQALVDKYLPGVISF